eukprot:TRINITY_DN2797_c0_g1_i1.p1 TRINITY_DN2797_c0_g1~~TRINITY_DN2797_c0_g1_i1.p1  ORF type:complete len:460 (-),score=169.73 TRINITY_DN2797_c0_g1_i1:45-1424(-)
MSEEKPVVILGAGLAGSLLACFLANRGHKVNVYEMRGDMRQDKSLSAGRSINLALSQRGINALKKVGLQEDVMSIAIPMKGRTMHSVDGTLTFQPYSKDGNSSIYSISRGELNCRLMTLSEKNPKIKYFFDSKVSGMDLKEGRIMFKDSSSVDGETMFATDGAFSVSRSHLMRAPGIRFNYSQDFLPTGYKELHIPPGEDGKHQLDKNSLHIWPRGHLMMIALPNLDGSFTVTCFFPFEGHDGFDVLDNASEADVLEFFKKTFPDVVPLMPDLAVDFKKNPTSSLVTVKCWPWSFEDKICLLGDASHAIVPFFGQGMNCAFEDCDVLDDILEKAGDNGIDWKKIFKEFQESRKPNTDAIAKMAKENHYEMRDKVGDATFLFRNKVQHLLGKQFPDRFLSRYEMISFSQLPYREALERGETNAKIIDQLTEGLTVNDIDKIDMKKAEKLVNENLSVLQWV